MCVVVFVFFGLHVNFIIFITYFFDVSFYFGRVFATQFPLPFRLQSLPTGSLFLSLSKLRNIYFSITSFENYPSYPSVRVCAFIIFAPLPFLLSPDLLHGVCFISSFAHSSTFQCAFILLYLFTYFYTHCLPW